MTVSNARSRIRLLENGGCIWCSARINETQTSTSAKTNRKLLLNSAFNL